MVVVLVREGFRADPSPRGIEPPNVPTAHQGQVMNWPVPQPGRRGLERERPVTSIDGPPITGQGGAWEEGAPEIETWRQIGSIVLSLLDDRKPSPPAPVVHLFREWP